MNIKKGTKLTVYHDRKGVFNAIADKDFDTEKDEWYPVIIDNTPVNGVFTETRWEDGAPIPCRKMYCSKVAVRNE
jgi:hypothetical protein